MRLIPRRRNMLLVTPTFICIQRRADTRRRYFISFFFFLISFARDSGSARRPGSGKRSYKRKAEAALAFSTPVVREGEIKSGKKAWCSGKGGRGVEGGEKSFENYRRAAISPDGVLNFLPRGFTGRQLGPPAKKRIRTVSFASRCVFCETTGSQLICNEIFVVFNTFSNRKLFLPHWH